MRCGRSRSMHADPFSPCRAYGEPYATSCWLFQGLVILRANGFDAGRALRVCGGAPGARAARCWILDHCVMGQAVLAPHCAAGAALALESMDWSGFRAARLCAAEAGELVTALALQ